VPAMHMTEWLSEDGRFAAKAPQSVIDGILDQCRASGSHETGGIMVGYYTCEHDCAVITGASPAPPDSRSGQRWLYRGVRGLRAWLRRLWSGRPRTYYLGEWHFHPSGSSAVSPRDARQIASNASCPSYHCPEPLLLIVGGRAEGLSAIGLYVCPRTEAPVRLSPVWRRTPT